MHNARDYTCGEMGKVPNHKAKKGNNKKGALPFKRARLERFNNRHIDQVHAAFASAAVHIWLAHSCRVIAAQGKRLGVEIRSDRHITVVVAQVWKDVRADPEKPIGPNGELAGIRADAALPRTAKQVMDEDLPGMGQFYCK